MSVLEQEFEESLRNSLHAVIAQPPAADVGDRLRDLGWHDLVAETPAAFALLYDELGRAACATGLVDELVRSELPPDLGQTCDRVVYPRPARTRGRPAVLADDSVVIDGWMVCEPTENCRLLFSAYPEMDTGTPSLAITATGAARRLEVQRVPTFDVQGSWVRIKGILPRSVVDITADRDGNLWRAALDSARRAAAYEIVGLLRGTLAMAVAHVTSRVQFGRPIGSFQAVRHRLADAHTALTASQELVDTAWSCRDSAATAGAFAYAARAHRAVTAHCLQVCGAIGMTWEHDLHRYLRRGYALDAFFGPADSIVKELGGDLIQAPGSGPGNHL